MFLPCAFVEKYCLSFWLSENEVAQSCPTLCNPMGCSPTRLLCPWDFPGNSPGVDCLFLLQGIFPTQGSNLGLLHCRQTLYRLSHQGSPLLILLVMTVIVRFIYRIFIEARCCSWCWSMAWVKKPLFWWNLDCIGWKQAKPKTYRGRQLVLLRKIKQRTGNRKCFGWMQFQIELSGKTFLRREWLRKNWMKWGNESCGFLEQACCRQVEQVFEVRACVPCWKTAKRPVAPAQWVEGGWVSEVMRPTSCKALEAFVQTLVFYSCWDRNHWKVWSREMTKVIYIFIGVRIEAETVGRLLRWSIHTLRVAWIRAVTMERYPQVLDIFWRNCVGQKVHSGFP